MNAYRRPQTLTDALDALSARPHVILAGATDLFPAEANSMGWGRRGLAHPESQPLLDISDVSALRDINELDDRVEIGALVTWSDAIQSELPSWFNGVRLAGREVGGCQIQNRGTLAGNLCNASPAADGVPALLSLNASVRLQRHKGRREVPLETFITGNRRTCAEPDELLTNIVIPKPAASAQATFLKLGARRYLVISIAMVAVCMQVEDNHIIDVRIAVGACSKVALRLRGLESKLIGVAPADAAAQVQAGHFSLLSPIADVRASADYRRHSAMILVQRALASLAPGNAA